MSLGFVFLCLDLLANLLGELFRRLPVNGEHSREHLSGKCETVDSLGRGTGV